MTRAEKVWSVRKICIKANPKLWDDHGNVLKRVTSPGVAVPTRIMLTDALLAWRFVYDKQVKGSDEDEDAKQVFNEISEQIRSLWDMHADDLISQSDVCIDLLADRLT